MRAERPRFGARWQGAASHVPNCMSSFYGADLASVHHTGFAGFARKSARGLLALIHSAGIDDGLVVDLGCGSGVWAGELLRAGYDVLGVDASAAMIRLARSVAPGARFAVGSIQDAVLPPCVAVTAIGEVVTYLDPRRNRGDVSSLFRRVHRALRPGGLFVFDAVERSETDPMHYRARRDGTGWRVIADVFEEPAKSLLTRRITVVRKAHGRERRTEEIHRLQTFSRAELEQPCARLGFRCASDAATARFACRRTGWLSLHASRILDAGSRFVGRLSPSRKSRDMTIRPFLEQNPFRAHIHGHSHAGFGRVGRHFNVASAGRRRAMILNLDSMEASDRRTRAHGQPGSVDAGLHLWDRVAYTRGRTDFIVKDYQAGQYYGRT